MIKTSGWLRNPLHTGGTDLPPTLTLIARTLALTLLLLYWIPYPRKVPYFGLINALGSDTAYELTLLVLLVIGYLLVIFTPKARAGCGLIGLVLLISLLGCRGCHSVGHTYVACMFLLLALTHRTSDGTLLRFQLAILYLAAALNKAVDPDWWNGRYFEALLVHRHPHQAYMALAALLPPLWLSITMGISTIVIQALLGLSFLKRRWAIAGVILGTLFHTLMILITNDTYGPFFPAIVLSYVATLQWPDAIPVSLPPTLRWLAPILTSINVDRLYQIETDVGRGLIAHVNGTEHRGLFALLTILFFNPLTFYGAAFLLTDTHWYGLLRNVAVAIGLCLFTVFAAKYILSAAALRSQRATPLRH